jgi:hypothetical protein
VCTHDADRALQVVDVFDGTQWSVLSLPIGFANARAVTLSDIVVFAGGSNAARTVLLLVCE